MNVTERRLTIAEILDQHVEDLADVWNVRDGLAARGHVTLATLGRFDERVAANHDGCVAAGQTALQRCLEQMELPQHSGVFAAAVVALLVGDRSALSHCVSRAQRLAHGFSALCGAIEWVNPTHLVGWAKEMLRAADPFKRAVGLASCRVHRVDPGLALTEGLTAEDARVRVEALRTAGDIGRVDLLGPCVDQIDDSECGLWAARSAMILGERSCSRDRLVRTLAGPLERTMTFDLALQSMAAEAAQEVLVALAADPRQVASVIRGIGIAGQAIHVPWLIARMGSPDTARGAGEAFSLITGVDLERHALERTAPKDRETGPNDDADDSNVEMDPDDGLPWPDPQRIEKWWAMNGSHFQKGIRLFMGAPVTRDHCIDVLKNGYQRQRILAAHYLCLLEPGTPLFNTSAPAWRQERLLTKMAGLPGSPVVESRRAALIAE
jgi:uncharacterized protein (TIGR02270 family)